MKPSPPARKRGFSLIETVIAIGVLAVLLTGFMIVFAPAAAGVRKAINVQEADRLASTLEQELVTLRQGDKTGDIATGFDKAFFRIKDSTGPNQTGMDSGDPSNALLLYQYRGKTSKRRTDETPEPLKDIGNSKPGDDYILVTMMRRRNDPLFSDPQNGDISAIEGGVYLVKCVQLVFDNSQLQPIDTLDKSLRGKIKNPKPNSVPPDPNYKPGPFDKPSDFPEAVIAFSADFYSTPTKAPSFFGTGGKFDDFYKKAKTPVFTRNLAVRR